MNAPQLPIDAFVSSVIAASQWEKAFASFLVIERGWHVLLTCDLHGGYAYAPQFNGVSANLVAPDLLAARNGEMRWFEVKQKSHADWHRNSQRFVTGLPLHLWNDYQRVERLTGHEVTVVFIHQEEGIVCGGTLKELDALVSHRYTQSVMDKAGTIFFKFDALPRWIHTARLEQYMEKTP